jgi:hypothetical protein
MDDKQLEVLLEDAAERGAAKALHSLGLHDEDAYDDMHELRGLLDSWRATKRTVGNTVARVVTTVILSALATSVWFTWGEH